MWGTPKLYFASKLFLTTEKVSTVCFHGQNRLLQTDRARHVCVELLPGLCLRVFILTNHTQRTRLTIANRTFDKIKYTERHLPKIESVILQSCKDHCYEIFQCSGSDSAVPPFPVSACLHMFLTPHWILKPFEVTMSKQFKLNSILKILAVCICICINIFKNVVLTYSDK